MSTIVLIVLKLCDRKYFPPRCAHKMSHIVTIWSSKVCAAPGSCSPLPKLPRGRSVPVRGSRGAAMRFKCRWDLHHWVTYLMIVFVLILKSRAGKKLTRCYSSGSEWVDHHIGVERHLTSETYWVNTHFAQDPPRSMQYGICVMRKGGWEWSKWKRLWWKW